LHTSNKNKPTNTTTKTFYREFSEGGNCIYYDEPNMLKAVEKRLGELKVTRLTLPDLALPEDIEKMMASGGYGALVGEGATDPNLAMHLEQLKGDVKTLGVLEFQLQTHFLRMQKRREGAEAELIGMELDNTHNNSGFKRED
jgi:hypothetical protein